MACVKIKKLISGNIKMRMMMISNLLLAILCVLFLFYFVPSQPINSGPCKINGRSYENCKKGADLFDRPCAPSDLCWKDLDANPLLPRIEVDAYNDMVSMLQIPTPPRVSSICTNQSTKGISIDCDCATDASNTTKCHVTSITIYHSSLRGILPESLSNFTRLEYLDLEDNLLQQGIPESLGQLSSLRYLDLSQNQLNGSIPKSLGDLNNLWKLDLSSNLLTGSIPPSFAALHSLQFLYLSENMLSGPIPDFLGKLTNLTYLLLADNQFNGSLPTGIANLTNLEALNVASNNLSGRIPDAYAPLTNIYLFVVGGNYMSGRIPSFFKNWTKLDTLDLMGNNFEGPVPLPEIFQFSDLEYLAVSDLNNSSIQLPSSANLSKMDTLILRHCPISGEIPPYIGNMSSLRKLDLSFNELTGGIPKSMQNLTLLSYMALAGNKLNGTFPDWLTKKSDLIVDLSQNNLRVNDNFRPQNLSNMNLFECCSSDTSTKRVNMTPYTQVLETHCPDGKSKYSSLLINCGGEEKFLPEHYYADNYTSNFHVSEGQWAYSCSGLFMSDFDANYIQKTKFGVFDVNAPLYETARLCPVSLTYYGYCLQKGNYTVQLHFSEIVYTENGDYSSLRNRVFDIYIQDKLEVKDFNIKEKAGGPNTPCNETFTVHVDDSFMKIQLLWTGKGSSDGNGPLISAISAVKVVERKPNVLKIALIVVSSIIVAMLLLLFCTWKMGWLENKDLYAKRIELPRGSITVKQLIDATRNFSQKMEIGKGGFGAVYKAELLNEIVAVKKLSSQSRQGMDEFNTEDFTLKTLRHENLVQLLGAYSSHDLHLLIYEYVENNSLANALFDPNSSSKLDWETRYSICVGIAKGLKYLHEESRVKIVHRDIKASNVLLDRNFKAKISDFGLARLYDGETNMVTKIEGTYGYMAPEYAMRGTITYKADVYSFGVLLLEIVSGETNSQQILNQENIFLLDTAYVLHKQGRLIELVDKRLLNQYDRKQASTALSLGMICTSQSHALRPTMSEVLSVLEGDRTIEEVSVEHGPAAGDEGDRAMAYSDNSVTDISNTNTEGTSGSSTSFFVIKDKDESPFPRRCY